MNRRNFVKKTGLAGAALSLPVRLRESRIKAAIIGCGLRGQSHASLLLKRGDVDLVAIADPDAHMCGLTKALFEDHSVDLPAFYSDGKKDYINMLDQVQPELVIIATPWRWHTEMAVACLERNIYTGLEVSGAFSIDECWALVEANERSRSELYFLEIVCFRRDVMAVLRMVRQGLFGELIHLECGYQHDLRAVKFNNGKQAYGGGVEYGASSYSEARWRTDHSIHRNGDLYPTHGIGPVSQYIDINRGNRFLYLNAVSSKARGLHDYIINHPAGGAEHPNADIEFKLGDKITSVIKCNNGETIVIHHDTSLPRPYSLGFRVQGTKGLWMDINNALHIEGRSPAHKWEDDSAYMKEYDHPLWKRYEEQASGAGHGGMDFFLINSLVECAKRNEVPPFDVYDAASWMAITPLSERSIATGSSPQYFPDFTRGRWINRTNKFGRSDAY